MTDKKIIIDGVDVSKCAYFDYKDEGTKECYAHSNECEANDCYFKQLKHTETELKIEKKYRGIAKRLINLLRTKEQKCNDLISENDFLLQKLEAKEQECEKLKITLMKQDEINTFFNTPIDGWSNDPCGVCEYKGEYSRCLKALEEIENFFEHRCNLCREEYDLLPCDNCINKQILGIINKTKGWNND